MFTKNYNFWRFLELYGHIFKATMVKFGMRVRSWGFLPQAKFCKNDLRGYVPLGKKLVKGVHPFLAKSYQKLAILAILTPVSPHF